MARALLGHVDGSNRAAERVLAAEVVRLRRRVAELETEVAQLREHRSIELELHELTTSGEPALA